jgi:hypothetical protein
MGSFAATGTCIPAELIPPNRRLSASGPHTFSGPLGPAAPLAPDAAASPAACAMMTDVRVRVRLSSWGAVPDSPDALLLPADDVSALSFFVPPGRTRIRRELRGTHLRRVAKSQE